MRPKVADGWRSGVLDNAGRVDASSVERSGAGAARVRHSRCARYRAGGPAPWGIGWLRSDRQVAGRYDAGVARAADDLPTDPALVVLNPGDEVTPEAFAAWLDRRRSDEPTDPGLTAAETLAAARAAGEV